MIFFTTHTPAENLVIRDQRHASHRQMLELTLMDLLLKKVLKLEYDKDETANPTNDASAQSVAYVAMGENYPTYAPMPHEQIFMKPFVSIVTTRILLGSLVKVIYEDARHPTNFRSLVAKSPRISKYFRSPWFFHTLGFQRLTNEGERAKEHIFAEQITLGESFQRVWQTDRSKALAIISEVNGNIFLLPLSVQMIKALGFEMDAYTSPMKKSDFAGGGCGGFYYSDYDHVSGGFGEHEPAPADGGSGDSGCGGDSGCSGCGGCGGD